MAHITQPASASSSRQAVGRRKSGASQAAPYASPKNPPHGGRRGAEREGRALFRRMLRHDASDQHDRVEVHVRVQQAQGQGGQRHVAEVSRGKEAIEVRWTPKDPS